MPFTLSHPAAVLPFLPLARRSGVPVAALAIGAMSPDFEFFVHLAPRALFSHTLPGLLGFCLPVGLVVYALWVRAAAPVVRHLFAIAAAPATPIAWGAAGIGILFGAATHLIWDGLTHGTYWGAALWPWLREPAVRIGALEIPWFNLLQHLSTLIGGGVVLAWSMRYLRAVGDLRAPLRDPRRRRAVGLVLLAAVAVAVANGARGPFGTDFWTAQRLLGRIAVGAMLGAALGIAWLTTRPRGAEA